MKGWLSLTLILLVNSTQTQCPPFSLNQCQFAFKGEECAFANCTISHRNSENEQNITSDWTLCLSSCCSNTDPTTTPFFTSLLTACAAKKQDESDDAAFYELGFALGVVLTLIILCYCYGLERLRKLLCTSPQEKMQVSQLQLQFNHPPKPRNQINPAMKGIIKYFATEENCHQEKTCCICLEEETNVRSSCGHEYHWPCIQQWYRRKQECPECRQQCKAVTHAVICRHCRKQNHLTNLTNQDFSCQFCT